jgi:hypothetical protein
LNTPGGGYLTPEGSRHDAGMGGGGGASSSMSHLAPPPTMHTQGLIAARAEADRLVRDAEAKGREACARLSKAFATFDARDKSGWASASAPAAGTRA